MDKIIEKENINIVGIVVNVRPDKQSGVELKLMSTGGVEIHSSVDGKLVITIDESECKALLVDTITEINNIPAVLSTSIAYHQFEGDLAFQEKKNEN